MAQGSFAEGWIFEMFPCTVRFWSYAEGTFTRGRHEAERLKRKKASQFSGSEGLIPEIREGMSTALASFPWAGSRGERNVHSGRILFSPKLGNKENHLLRLVLRTDWHIKIVIVWVLSTCCASIQIRHIQNHLDFFLSSLSMLDGP